MPASKPLPTFAGLGKLPPQAPEFEAAILGAMLIESACIAKVLGRIKSADVFYLTRHEIVFGAIVELFRDSRPVDILTVTQQLRRMGKLDEVGGPVFLAGLTETVNSAANIEEHCMVVYDQYARRQIIAEASYSLDKAYDQTVSVPELLERIQMQGVSLTNQISARQAVKMGDLVRPALEEVERAMKTPGGVTGVPSGISDVDAVTGGWQPSDLIIVAARPAMGKTSFVLQVLKNAALDYSLPVAIFSLEMGAIQLTKKVMANEARLTTNQMVKGAMERTDFERLHKSTRRLESLPIYVDDTAGVSIGQIRAKSIALKLKYNIQMVVVDYLQLASGEGKGSREQEISSISRGLKMLAKDLNVPVIALSQLSRAVEQRGDKRPMLSDLRESGAIEQDADVVMFLFRPEYYGITEDEEGQSTEGVIDLLLAKHRNGGLKDVRLKGELQYSSIAGWDDFRPQVREESAMASYDGRNAFENDRF